MNQGIGIDNRKKMLTIGAILTGVGVAICTIASAMIGFNFKKLSTVSYVSNTYEVSDAFKNINIKATTEKINFVPSENEKCKVVCYEEENKPHQVSVENHTLLISRTNSKINLSIGLITESPEITVYLPQKDYELLTIEADTGDIMIPKDFSFETMNMKLDTGDISCFASAKGTISMKTDTGNIQVSDISASDMNITSDTGKMELSNVTLTESLDIQEHTGKVTLETVSCKNFTSTGSTGSLIMTDVIASENVKLKRDTGSIKFNNCDAETISVKTSTGSVSGTLLSEKVFIAETSTGSVNVPKTTNGGKCEITTDTGSINIEVQ